MNKHITNWLQAYHDNELSEERRHQVAAHLTICEPCQQELAELQALSAFLQEGPAPQTKTRPEQFVAQVKLQLPHQQKISSWQRTRRWLWYQVPVALILVLLVLQTTTLTNNLFLGIQRFGIGGQQINSLLATDVESLGWRYTVDLPELGIVKAYSFAQDSFGIDSFFGLSIPNFWVLPTVLGLLYFVWMTGWWINETQE